MEKEQSFVKIVKNDEFVLFVTGVRNATKDDAIELALKNLTESELQGLKITKTETKELMNNLNLALLFLQKEKATN